MEYNPIENYDRFQFTPLREGRRCLFGNFIHFENFNSRPSARGDQKAPEVAIGFAIFQFTPLREGRPGFIRSAMGTFSISIHAPPRGATFRV